MSEKWFSVEAKEYPEKDVDVLFVCELDDQFSDIAMGAWTGNYTAGFAIVMDDGDFPEIRPLYLK